MDFTYLQEGLFSMLSTEISVAIIAFIGVFISAAISFLISKGQRRQDVEKTYAAALNEKRLEYYPELFHCISDFLKVLRFKEVTLDSLREFLDKFEFLDSKLSIYFTKNTGAQLHVFHKEFYSKLNKYEKSDQIEKDELDKLCSDIELQLKEDLGVYFPSKLYRTESTKNS